jgi:hypothetical protein
MILDGALEKPEYAEATKQAERDLPGDKWTDKPWHMNVSQDEREHQLTMKILDELEPQFKRMSVTELVRAFKVVPNSPAGVLINVGHVQESVYFNGNMEIMKEIKSRPKEELKVLPNLADDSFVIFLRPQGPMMTLSDFVLRDVYDK